MTRMETERRRRGWSQTELAYHSRLSQGDISRIERRRIIPTELYLSRVGRVLGIPLEELLEEVPPQAAGAALEVSRELA